MGTGLLLVALGALAGADVTVVVPADRSHAEYKAAVDTAKFVSGLFAELGIPAEMVDDKKLAAENLAKRRLVVLPYNPALPKAAADAIAKYLDNDGRLIACYTVPASITQRLGVRSVTWTRQKQPGYFSEMRFEGIDDPAWPKRVHQESWNIAAPTLDANARTIAQWHDDQGRPTGHAAVVLSTRGAFISHILLTDDRDGKKRLLAALAGHFCPDLKAAMAKKAEADAETARQLIVYAKSLPSKPVEGRAVWNHSGLGAYPGDWDRSAKELAAAGFNMVLPNLLWGGLAHYPSDLLPRSETFDKYGDQAAQCCTAAKKYGLEVHVWKVNFNLSNAPAPFVDKMRSAGRLIVTVRGETRPWLCPSHPDNTRLECDTMLEVAQKYPINGLHFDYIRYPDGQCCYCPGCRQRFEATSGKKVANWPADCFKGDRAEEYRDWRCDQITRLVAMVREQTKRHHPTLKISAAVFGAYPDCRRSVGQDWPRWVEAGYLDFICPMDYTGEHARFCGWLENQLKLVDGRIPIYPGIGALASTPPLTPQGVLEQAEHASRLGAAGFTIFEFRADTARSLLPLFQLGIGTVRAKSPHQTKTP